MIAALDGALVGLAAIVVATGVESVVAVRVAPRETGLVVLVIDSSVPKLDRAMLLAAVGPLAEELAPATRLAALDLAGGAREADVIAAAVFLTTARSTTGQVLRVG